jgi:hypothetical protein
LTNSDGTKGENWWGGLRVISVLKIGRKKTAIEMVFRKEGRERRRRKCL